MAAATNVPGLALDDTDLRILRTLREDGRASHREVAARTGASLATVNRRVRALEERGVIQGYTTRIDPHAVGWQMTVVVGLRIDKGYLREVQKEIAKDKRIFSVYDVTGEWDGLVIARVRGRQDLDDLIKTTLSGPHIQRSSTMVVLSTLLEELAPHVP